MQIKFKKKGLILPVAPFYKAAAGGGSTFVFKGQDGNGNSTSTRDFTINVGTSAGLIIVGCISQNNDPTAVIVDPAGVNITLTQDVGNTGGSLFSGIYSGTIGAGLGSITIRVTGAGAFSECGVNVWVATGLSSNLVKQTAKSLSVGANTTINVASTDYLVAMAYTNGGTHADFVGSSGSPVVRNNTSVIGTSAEWLPTGSTNASFAVVPNSGTPVSVAAASYA